MPSIKLLGLIFLTGAACSAVVIHKLKKTTAFAHKPKKNRVIEVELSEGVDPEDIIITVPRRTK